MPQFVIPQFIERKPRIVGPLTLEQFVIVAIGVISAFILFLLIRIPVLQFFVAGLIGLCALALAFGKVGPYSMPEFLKNAFLFFVSSKVYVWQKKTIVSKISLSDQRLEKIKMKEKEAPKTPELKMASKSKLNDLATKIEINQK